MKEIKDIVSRPSPPSLPIPSKQSVLVVPPLPTDLFSGREDELKEMERCFEFPKTSVGLKKQRRFVLYGTGGMGKTQMALKFLERNDDRYVLPLSRSRAKLLKPDDQIHYAVYHRCHLQRHYRE